MADFVAPQILKNKYKLVGLIGGGTFGQVMLYELNQEYYAVKFFIRERSSQDYTYEKVMMKKLLKIKKRNNPQDQSCQIPELIDDGMIESNYRNKGTVQFLIMQYIEYSTYEYLSSYPDKEKDLFVEMVIQLREFHKLGYIHKDIKPDNFRVNREGKVFFIDFGTTNKFNPNLTATKEGRINIESSFTASKFVNAGAYAMQIDELISVLYSMILIKEPSGIEWENNGFYVQLDQEQKTAIIDAKNNFDLSRFRQKICQKAGQLIKKLENIRENDIDIQHSINPDYDQVINEIKQVYSKIPIENRQQYQQRQQLPEFQNLELQEINRGRERDGFFAALGRFFRIILGM
ncbi:serine threonine protein kinase [Stylonychia lemnae]|uniref:Serine threonine protein kinase n=1 Tax=Stylonychia lemnae TaxID=5949 RepID=A0A078AHM9_STYLE|nr:serine threonine protein kinase [Stylonychia lemnae]|eukprot:CDW81785.1 serine threonine protein kinase [Stylonychia lemnae]